MVREKETGLSFARQNSSVHGRRDSFHSGDARMTSTVPNPGAPVHPCRAEAARGDELNRDDVSCGNGRAMCKVPTPRGTARDNVGKIGVTRTRNSLFTDLPNEGTGSKSSVI